VGSDEKKSWKREGQSQKERRLSASKKKKPETRRNLRGDGEDKRKMRKVL